jgi:MoxR-like ATPase
MGEAVEQIQREYGIIGRAAEIAASLACLLAGRHLLLEGPVGVGKTVLATAIARHLGRAVFRVDGDERYTEQKLTGWFDPPLVLKVGYVADAFMPGPLLEAMEAGGVLFINELNRMPESVQNVLLPSLDEGLLTIPRLGLRSARGGFAVIATQNPREFVATGHLSEALRDRFELVRLDYQTADQEVRIVERHAPGAERGLVREAVELVRETRRHPYFKRGGSIRAAMAIVEIARHLDGDQLLRRAALLALPTRVELREDLDLSLEQVIDEILGAGKKKA